MSRTFRQLAFRCPLALAVVLATAAVPAGAQSVTMNFNSITAPAGSDYGYVNNCYTESGFQVTAVSVACGTPFSFAHYAPTAGPAYTGSTALFLNTPNATLVDFTRVGGGMFSMQSASFSPFDGPGPLGGGATTVSFIGTLFNGSSVSQTFNVLSTVTGLQTFTFGSMFTGLTSVRMAALDLYGDPVVQFDNLVFTPAATAVPEPATVALVAGGLLGVAAAARRRRRTTDDRSHA